MLYTFSLTGESIGFSILGARLVGYGEVKTGEEKSPSGLPGIQAFS